MSMVCSRAARNSLMLVLLWAALQAPVWSDSQQYEGKAIVEIQFSPPDQPVDPADLRELVSLKKGAPLRLADIRAAIQKLFGTGYYEDIQVDAEPSGDGVVVRFITQNSWFVGRVSVEGNVSDPPNRGQMVNATGFQLGLPFREESMGAAEESLRKLLVNDGYFENRVTQRIEYEPKTQQAHIHFVVESGPAPDTARPF